MDVTFKLETFEGPLDLLLHLIAKNKVSITDIPITLITHQYIEYINQMKQFDMEITGDFLVMAAQLLFIKSRMLLPQDEKDDDGIDPRAQLVDRLLEYAKYRDAIGFLNPRQGMSKYVYYKKPDNIKLPKVRKIEMNIPISKLTSALADVLERKEFRRPVKREHFDAIVRRETVSVSTRIKFLFALFKIRQEICFDEFFEDASSKAEAVSTFLATLELMRRGNMTINGDEFGRLHCRLSGDESEFDKIDSDY